MFGMPSVVTNKVDLPNLSNRHIMWCKVKSGGIDLSLPLDSCCSVSLCSLEHAKLMQEKYPSFKWVKLPSPVAIHVANEDAGLQGVGMQDVRIDWGPGKYSVHTMLVVPKLSFPVLFGNNHLESCDTVVSHKECIVHFRHPAIQFKVKCPSEPPRRPNGTVETNVVSLYVCSEKPQKLQRGINLVTLCLSLAFFAGGSNFIGNQGNVTDLAALNPSIEGLGKQFWLTHSDKFPSDDLFLVPGPVNIKDLHRHTVGVQHDARPVNVKCHPSRPLVDSGTMDDLTIEPSTKVYVTVAVYNRSNTAQILPSGIIGDIHVSDSDSDTKFQAAATDTAEQLADNVIKFLSSQAAFYEKALSHSPASSAVTLKRRLRSFFPDDAHKEMDKAFGNQSLNTFLEHKFITGLIDDDRDVPPLGDTKLDPYSEEYKDKVLAELRLNDNHELSDEQRTQLTDLIRRYGHVFMLPGAPFKGVDHTFHEIDTGDSQPQYTPPYPKSPAQLQIIKEEIQKMIEQDILEPSNSPWGPLAS